MRTRRGYTLIETLLSLLVGGILVAITVAGVRPALERGRMRHAAGTITGDLLFAQAEAARTRSTVVVVLVPNVSTLFVRPAAISGSCPAATPAPPRSWTSRASGMPTADGDSTPNSRMNSALAWTTTPSRTCATAAAIVSSSVRCCATASSSRSAASLRSVWSSP